VILRASIVLFLLVLLAAGAWLSSPLLRWRFGRVDFQDLSGADRVRVARWQHGASVQQAFEQAGVDFPPDGIFLRVFKREGRLELWARKGGVPFRLIRSYAITQSSGKPGPKRREGDLQVPEGFYEIDRFNPESSYHLSLGLNYPNASDRLRSDPERPGYDIFLHGGAGSIGCVPLGDAPIEEVFLALWEAREHGLRSFPVHVFPGVMRGPDWDAFAGEQTQRDPALRTFWDELQPGYDAFEATHLVPDVTVESDGRYVVKPPER
jgi:murein L,D-transpeptidase YafK